MTKTLIFVGINVLYSCFLYVIWKLVNFETAALVGLSGITTLLIVKGKEEV